MILLCELHLSCFLLKLLTFFGAANKDELDLMSQVTELKKQMSRINMVDEFAAYARLQRQSNKLRDQIKSRGKFYNARANLALISH